MIEGRNNDVYIKLSTVANKRVPLHYQLLQTKEFRIIPHRGLTIIRHAPTIEIIHQRYFITYKFTCL